MDLGPSPLLATFSWPPAPTSIILTNNPVYVADIPETETDGWSMRKSRHLVRSIITRTQTFTVTEIVYIDSLMALGDTATAAVPTDGASAALAGFIASGLADGQSLAAITSTSAFIFTTPSSGSNPTTYIAALKTPILLKLFQPSASNHYTDTHTFAKRDGLSDGAIAGIAAGCILGMTILIRAAVM